ncbi:MAG: ribose 5-phosphate isomerase B [Bdellovibrionales bacterium]|jgi:ribose 5-phosphate isomerase B|nr:ribose 5-phosphate isomerase B [Bdellovibrionales bacterium]
MKVFIASDHAAFECKNELIDHLINQGHKVKDLGPFNSERCNYPDYAKYVAEAVSKNDTKGILLCGSGIGVSIVANRFAGIRAALCRSSEDAKLSREHNDSNIICFGARVSTLEAIKEMTDTWLATEFSQGRHSERIELFNNLGEKL